MSVAPRIQSKCFLQKRTRYRSQLRIRQSTCSAEIAPTPPVRSNLCTSLTAVPSKITKTMSGKATVEEQFSSKIIHPAMRVQHSHSSSACALPQDQLFIVCFATRPTALRQLFGVCFVTTFGPLIDHFILAFNYYTFFLSLLLLQLWLKSFYI